nr:immunoglobulin light chain junction region [Macaca mulatta]MOY05042.1 immunoglobulin light chain junction region [Macaca mulatta]MOY05683.1 immunoglobulin light chain junction region [Macaca mulatta]MOY05894.1 immunoglobulin light chain junction region [Macaca mulatta]MOY05896.1 immunoglobulin light chain junction region [Macaca mulatta]
DYYCMTWHNNGWLF